MAMKPAYEELEQRITELEKEVADSKRAKKLEEALRENEYLYKTLIEGPLFAMIIHDVAPYFGLYPGFPTSKYALKPYRYTD